MTVPSEKKLIYVVPQFYPNNTGFGIAFTNFSEVIIQRGYFNRIIVITGMENADIPSELEGKCEVLIVKNKGLGILQYLPFFLAKKFVFFLFFRCIKKIKSLAISAEDEFFYEEFGMGPYKYVFEKIFPKNRHIIRVHGTFPEFTMHYKRLKRRKIFFRLAVSNKEINIATTTNFYIDYLNKYFFKESYDLIQKINYYIIPNLLLKADCKKEVSYSRSLRLLQLGRMDKEGFFQKGFLDTLKALLYIESVLKEKSCNIEITLIGDGVYAYKIKDEIRRMKYIKVNFWSHKENSEILNILEKTDVVLMPSRCEGMSMFATESIYAEKAIIFTKNNGLQDYLIDGVHGYSMTEFDYIEMAKLIIKYYENRELISFHSGNNNDLSKDITCRVHGSMDILYGGDYSND